MGRSLSSPVSSFFHIISFFSISTAYINPSEEFTNTIPFQKHGEDVTVPGISRSQENSNSHLGLKSSSICSRSMRICSGISKDFFKILLPF